MSLSQISTSGRRCSPRITPMTWALALTTMQATEILSRCGDGAQRFSPLTHEKRAWHDFFDTEKDEFSIARDSSGFIIAQKEAQLMWRFDAVLYQSAVCIAAFKESSWQVSRIYPSCYGHFRPQGSNWDMSPLELVSRFLTRFPSSLICFCRCVMVGSISLPIHHFAKWGQWEPSPP